MLLLTAVPFLGAQAAAQAPPDSGSKISSAVRVAAQAIRLDGRLDEAAWTTAPPVHDFVQKEPIEGVPPSEQTEVRFVYDDNALYVGARMQSSGGRAAIQAPLGRRDDGTLAEFILVSLDTFYDRRTAYSFGVTASGVRLDHYHQTDNEARVDRGFDPVWEARVAIDDGGWSAEMWIPWSQLRFNAGTDQTWGLNIHRWIPSKNEDDYWVAIPRTDQAWASRFGQLTGIREVEASRRIEVLPYAAAGSTLNGDRDPANPFDDGLNLEGRVGLDLKVGIGPNLTLDGTITPDFGQVEADPAVVNLTDFEVFFPERRPFFTEGSDLLDGPANNYFYSRRIGAPPRGSAPGDFVDRPSSTTILGAAKLTGRLPSGTSLGFLAAVTDSEHAETFDLSGTFDEVQVTPTTSYGVARVQQEFGPPGSTASVIVTGVHRNMERGDPLAALLPRNALSAAAGTVLRLAGGTYEVAVSAGVTHVTGEEGAILRLQRASQRYFQRPDASHVEVDPNRTSLGGAKATLNARKISGEHWLWSVNLDLESPESEFNDIGRLTTGDGVASRTSLTYRETEPGARIRAYSFTFGQNVEWNLGGVRQATSLNGNSSWTWNNFWTTRATIRFSPRAQDQRQTRGGPSMGSGRAWSTSLDLTNSGAARTRWNGGVQYGQDELGGWSGSLSGGLSVVPTPRLRISLTPSFERQLDARQFVTSMSGGRPETFDARYVFAFIDRTTLATELRLNFTLKPDLNLDLFAQPFAASGRYYGFGELEAAESRFLRTYGTDGTTIVRLADGSYEVQDGPDTFQLANLDFRVRSFRSTAVVRWEWRPGSTLYLVWQQNRSGRQATDQRAGVGDVLRSLGATGNNFFAIKASYWIGG